MLLDPKGVVGYDSISLDKGTAYLCKKCTSSLKHGELPSLALANGMYTGPIPSELSDLTPVEESMIALCRAKCWILHLKGDSKSESPLPDVQRGIKGHIIIHPQHPEHIENVLPLTMDDAAAPICVIFIGHTHPSKQWLRANATPLCVCRDKVHAALQWLKLHNPLYHHVYIDMQRINALPEDNVLPVDPEVVAPSDTQNALQSRYDTSVAFGQYEDQIDGLTAHKESMCPTAISSGVDTYEGRLPGGDNTCGFESLVITDVDGCLPADKLRAATLRHFRREGGYLDVPHDRSAENEFFNPILFPKVYPTLYPYGIGGFEDCRRPVKASMKHHVKHLFNLSDKRFQ